MSDLIRRSARTARYLARRGLHDPGARLRRMAGAPADRRRSPIGPAATVREPGLDPRAMATRGEHAYFAGTSTRFATCTSVVWTRPDRLVTAFLLGRALVTYAVDLDGHRPRIRHLTTAVERERFGWVESMALSPDGRWLAVLDGLGGRCFVLAVDPTTGVPRPEPVTECHRPGDRVVHGVTFAPDGRSVVYTTIDGVGALRRAPFTPAAGSTGLGPVVELEHPRPGHVPKAVASSPDGRFLAIGYGPNVTRSPGAATSGGAVDVHRWDDTDVVGERVARLPEGWFPDSSVECLAWSPDGNRLVATDQIGHQALLVGIDPTTGSPTGEVERIGWAAGRLSFPHGCAVSPDGRWCAVTNYGDGTLRLYRLAP